jgi:uncharacterized membrane protein YidH (DUF202 family)
MEEANTALNQETDKEEKKKKKALKEAAKQDITTEKLMLAYERTLIAWIKAGTHLLIFGFALYQLMEAKLHDGSEHPVMQILTPRRMSFILFTSGFFSLLMATLRFVQVQKRFTQFSWASYFLPILILAYVILTLLLLLSVGMVLGR